MRIEILKVLALLSFHKFTMQCNGMRCEEPTHECRILLIESILAILLWVRCGGPRTYHWKTEENWLWSSGNIKPSLVTRYTLQYDIASLPVRSMIYTKISRGQQLLTGGDLLSPDALWVTSRLVSGFAETDSIGPRQVLQRDLVLTLEHQGLMNSYQVMPSPWCNGYICP